MAFTCDLHVGWCCLHNVYWYHRQPEVYMDDSKQTANWGRSVQSIHEEVGTDGQFSTWVWRARTDSWLHHQQLPTTSTTIRRGPLRSWVIDQSMALTDWVDNMRRWKKKKHIRNEPQGGCTDQEKGILWEELDETAETVFCLGRFCRALRPAPFWWRPEMTPCPFD